MSLAYGVHLCFGFWKLRYIPPIPPDDHPFFFYGNHGICWGRYWVRVYGVLRWVNASLTQVSRSQLSWSKLSASFMIFTAMQSRGQAWVFLYETYCIWHRVNKNWWERNIVLPFGQCKTLLKLTCSTIFVAHGTAVTLLCLGSACAKVEKKAPKLRKKIQPGGDPKRVMGMVYHQPLGNPRWVSEGDGHLGYPGCPAYQKNRKLLDGYWNKYEKQDPGKTSDK